MSTSPEMPYPLDLGRLDDDLTSPQLAAMYRALVEEIPAVLYINGPQENSPTLYVSPRTNEVLGLPPQGWYDDTWSTHVHPDDRAAVDANYVAALRHGASEAIDEYRFVRPDGQVVWLHDSIRVIRDDDGSPTLVQGVMFDITARKRSEELLSRQAALVERIAAAGQRFTQLLLEGGDLQAILDALADIVSAPVVFDDAARQLVGFATTAAMDDARLLEVWASHGHRGHVPDVHEECVWMPVRLRHEEWGRLHVLTDGAKSATRGAATDADGTGTETGTDPDEIDVIATDRAAAAIGLWLLSRQDRVALADRARSELIADLWQGRRWSAPDALARSRSLGGDLDRPVLLGVAVEFGREGLPAGSGAPDAATVRLLDSAHAEIRRFASAEGLSCMAAVVGSVCLAIVGFSTEAAARPVLGRLGAQLESLSRAESRGRTVAVGVSRPGSADGLRRILTEATDAAAHGAHSVRASGTYHSADLGLRHLLARLGDGPELGRFVEDELGPLLAHDATGRAPLIPTLRAFLDSGGRKSTAARTLHLERRSLYYRLERIEKFLEIDLADPSARLRVEVAVQGLDVLRQRRPGYGEPE